MSSLINILLVEDSISDRELTLATLGRYKFANKIHFVNNGREALDFLYKRGDYINVPTPDVILLDLNLPVMDGRETLVEIRKDKYLQSIPVVVLTSSYDEEDIVRCFDLDASCFVQKPMGFIEFKTVVESISHFGFSIVKLPRSDVN